MRKSRLIGGVFAWRLLVAPLAGDNAQPTRTSTERISVSAPGAIRFENAFGEIDIQGWDAPEVEVTTTIRVQTSYAKTRARAERRVEGVHVTLRREGNDVAISTAYPARSVFTHPFSRRGDVEIAYRIRAPRRSKLVVDHNSAGVNIRGIDGDIHATATHGQITLALPDAPFALDARCAIGNVYSDFEGKSQRRRVLGERFGRDSPPPAPNIYLRVRFGDIVVLREPGRPPR